MDHVDSGKSSFISIIIILIEIFINKNIASYKGNFKKKY
jgi:hypothetical protein